MMLKIGRTCSQWPNSKVHTNRRTEMRVSVNPDQCEKVESTSMVKPNDSECSTVALAVAYRTESNRSRIEQEVGRE